MLVSGPAFKRWELARGRYGFENLYLKAVSSLFFGGSIEAAGLLTVTDFQAALDSVPRLDLYRRILIPGVAFSRSGLDLRGVHYCSLEAGNVPVEIIP